MIFFISFVSCCFVIQVLNHKTKPRDKKKRLEKENELGNRHFAYKLSANLIIVFPADYFYFLPPIFVQFEAPEFDLG